ncbi:NAD-dependent epimerase/dehydratase family protein [Candidatus Atelocyanobacterium thalassae]|uniref:GDP-L-fucose synthase n=1 Tax=cyanobacterium endosymbiont of Braarudosphaera bigelowii TaxID=1285375 RepID=A0ABM7U672_9CHRO|nr:NAD-dependent epimerase/dehydratase family protein [Candidatus Atelocyanobacterium thalassa]BDA40248.1 GDP-L-fucose synthase [cyanobacterium endosymbiont of Braarudosphaera bigelowii]
MKILITGATGFLGTSLCSLLESQGHDLVSLNSKNCDLTKSDSLLKFNDLVYDQVYHLAAWTQAGDFCLYHPGEQWIVNQKININILDWWQKYQPQAKFICMGTSCAYDNDLSLIEENYLTGIPISSLFTYAMTKRMLYAGLLALNKQYSLNYLCLVPSTLYGAGYHTDGRQMHFIFDLIRKIIRGKLYNEPVILWGDGTQSRELVFVEDFAKIAIELAQSTNNELINIGAGEEYTIRHFAKLICNQVGYDFNKIQFDSSRYVGAKSKCLVINKLRQSLPDYDLTPLELGLTKTIEWFWQEQEQLVPIY